MMHPNAALSSPLPLPTRTNGRPRQHAPYDAEPLPDVKACGSNAVPRLQRYSTDTAAGTHAPTGLSVSAAVPAVAANSLAAFQAALLQRLGPHWACERWLEGLHTPHKTTQQKCPAALLPIVCAPAGYWNAAPLDDAAYREAHMQGATRAWLQELSPLARLLVLFLAYRRWDVASAAERFENLRRFMTSTHLRFSDMRHDDPEIRAVLRTGPFQWRPETTDGEGRAVFMLLPRNYDWDAAAAASAAIRGGATAGDGGAVRHVFRAWMYVSLVVMTHSPLAQSHGILLCNSMKDKDVSDAALQSHAGRCELELQRHIMDASLNCLPTRLARGYVAYVDRPPVELISQAPPMSRRTRDVFNFIGRDLDLLLRLVPPACLPTELGGDWDALPSGHELLATMFDVERYTSPKGVCPREKVDKRQTSAGCGHT